MNAIDLKRRCKYALFTVLAIAAPAISVDAQESGAASPPISNVAINNPTMIGEAGTWFGPDAYPPEAIRAAQQGRVEARLSIDAQGKTVGCAIATSSDSPSLDTATCQIAIEHLTFKPAWNTRGDSVPSEYLLGVRWVLPEPDLTPRLSFSTVTRLDVSSSGVVISCTPHTEGKDAGALAGDPCDGIGQEMEMLDMMKGPRQGQHALVFMQMALLMDGDHPYRDEHKIAGRTAFSVARAHFDIAPDGTIARCTMIENSGAERQPGLCDHLIEKFTPAKGKQRGATLLFAVSSAAAPAR